MSGRLYFTIGLPRSGKSTFCDKWTCEPLARPRVVVAGDDFRVALFGRHYQPEAEGTVFAMMDVAARALLHRGFDVVLDETCTTEETLKRYLRVDIDAEPIWINTPVEVCKERAMTSGKQYLVIPMERHAAQLVYLRHNWTEIFWRCREEIRHRKEKDILV